MARAERNAKNIQVFRGSKPRLGVFQKEAGASCCSIDGVVTYDKLGDVVHFDNGLNHLNPTGGNEKYNFPVGSPGGAFETDRNDIIAHINANGVGAQVSVIAIPNYAFVTGIAIKIYAEEEGLTFNLKTRNGLVLPADVVKVVTTSQSPTAPCQMVRTLANTNNMKFTGSGTTTGGSAPYSVSITSTQATADRSAFSGFGALGGNYYKDIIGRSGNGEFALEADEIIVEVATMPTSGRINGSFGFNIAVSYDVVDRAERA